MLRILRFFVKSYKFSNKGVKMCKATCNNCDLRYFYHFK